MASITELEDVQRELTSSKPTADRISRYLRLVRELKLRNCSDGVVRYGLELLNQHRGRLSEEELWLVHEQVAAAALDVGLFKEAAPLIRALAKQFPDSMRMKRLKGMYWEAQGKYDEADKIYKDMLETQPTNETAAKRMIAMDRTRGNLAAAVEGLRRYLEVHAADREAWEELGELYLELLMYRQAAFCWEELLLHAPTSTSYLLRYADILYTMGGSTNLRTARAYYAKAIELTGGRNARALYGVIACGAGTTDKVALQDSRTRAQIELPELTVQALLSLYREQAPTKQKLVEAVLVASLPSDQ